MSTPNQKQPRLIDPSAQYKQRRPVSILKAIKSEQLADPKLVDQTYLLDNDQPKETKPGDGVVVAQIPQTRNTIAAIARSAKKPDESIEKTS